MFQGSACTLRQALLEYVTLCSGRKDVHREVFFCGEQCRGKVLASFFPGKTNPKCSYDGLPEQNVLVLHWLHWCCFVSDVSVTNVDIHPALNYFVDSVILEEDFTEDAAQPIVFQCRALQIA